MYLRESTIDLAYKQIICKVAVQFKRSFTLKNMYPVEETTEKQSKIEKIAFNDKLGYAVVYYASDPAVRSEYVCNHRKHRIYESIDDKNFYDEIEAMVLRLERDDARKELKKINDQICDIFSIVARADLNKRELFGHKIKNQIKGKSADEICDILVNDVLQHAKCSTGPSIKNKFGRLPSAAQYSEEDNAEKCKINFGTHCSNSHIFQRVDKTLNECSEAEIHNRKVMRIFDKIQNDIRYLKLRCTQNINFPY